MDGFAEQLTRDLSPDDVRHVLAVFAADLARLAGVLTDACHAGEPEAFRRTAHALAGAAGAVGAGPLERACRVAMTDSGTEFGTDSDLGAPPLAVRLAGILTAAHGAETDLATFLARADVPGV